mmetsp:Transcript_56104/g.155358  ORF Transcript_56104/g.155358 Transcript_56104/m.155358 type:complete len:393 (-) Transcript_56104:68-1246(-)
MKMGLLSSQLARPSLFLLGLALAVDASRSKHRPSTEVLPRAPWDLNDEAYDVYSDVPRNSLLHVPALRLLAKKGSYIDFFGSRMCFPGFQPPQCSLRLKVANPWYSADCPNLRPGAKALDVDIAAAALGGRAACPYPHNGLVSPCAYLCYATSQYGTAVVPRVIWRLAQGSEGAWAKSVAERGGSADRPEEHWQGFGDYSMAPAALGSVIEVGAGPWTQTKGLLFKRLDAQISNFTIFEPNAKWYMRNVKTCSYKTGSLQKFGGSAGYHSFPVKVLDLMGESLLTHTGQYDTLVVMNVIEHVQDAFAFLQGLHRVIKPGGVLVFHERFYTDPISADNLLGAGGGLHPIRLTRSVFDVFLQQFDALWLNSKPTSAMLARHLGEQGYYFIGRKK